MRAIRQEVELGDATGAGFENLEPWVDPEILYACFPHTLLERLGHQPNARRRGQRADGAWIEFPVGDVPIRVGGETHKVLCAFGGPELQPALGRLFLATFGLELDPEHEILRPMAAIRR